MSFHTEILVESYGENGKQWILRRSYKFYYESALEKIHVKVPKGFITDFATIPRLLYSIFPPVGRYNKAAMMHDYLYDSSCPIKITRKEADLFFLQAMEVLGVEKWVRYSLFFAVRLFGKKHFTNKN
jgi:hypothetical protein